jgi:hypothetical protein
MSEESPTLCTAFQGPTQIASGHLNQIALEISEASVRGGSPPVMIFNDLTGELVETDARSTSTEPEPRRPGRPKLGVVAREVTLLPRHWDWLSTRPGGASVALRKLVESARRTNVSQDQIRLAQEAAYRFIYAIAGNEPGFEEVSRALFAGKQDRFREQMASWPVDIRNYANKLAAAVFQEVS